jgi:hypothetical protein
MGFLMGGNISSLGVKDLAGMTAITYGSEVLQARFPNRRWKYDSMDFTIHKGNTDA